VDISDIDLHSVDHVLTTTRAVRRRLDFGRPVERELIERCIDIAIQAPTALHGETWHFIVITEQCQRAAVAQIYRRAGEGHRSGALSLDPYLASLRAEKPEAPRFADQQRMFSSGAHLVRHMQDVPVLILACIEGRVENAGPGAQASLYGSIFPAVWSLMLAFRARGIGSVMTTQHIGHFEQDMATAVGLPDDMTQVALLAVAYFTGSDFKPANAFTGNDGGKTWRPANRRDLSTFAPLRALRARTSDPRLATTSRGRRRCATAACDDRCVRAHSSSR
jgi:nitroreductase